MLRRAKRATGSSTGPFNAALLTASDNDKAAERLRLYEQGKAWPSD